MATTKIPKDWMLPNSEKDFLYYESYNVALKLIEAIRERNVDDFNITVEQLGEAVKRLKKDAVAQIINHSVGRFD